LAKAVRLYWDSCAWLGLINGEADKRRELEIVYEHAKQGKYELWTSTLSMIECRWVAGERGTPKPYSEENEKLISDVFLQSFVKPIPLAADIAENARKIWRSTSGLGKYQDAVHVASAIRWDVPVLHTYDRDDLLHLDGAFSCKKGETLKICYPDETTDGPLFARSRNG
jgi:predicted nucleic acid-binding protein